MEFVPGKPASQRMGNLHGVLMFEEFEEKYRKKKEQIEIMLKDFLPAEEGFQKTVLEAVNYSLTAGGKRLRPLFLAECSLPCGGGGLEDRLVRAFAAALEVIHTYSLVHDDLPAMDNDEYRRGKLTTHAKYGEAMGILAGDALLTLAFETAAGAVAQEHTADRLSAGAKALSILAGKAGLFGMLGGQAVDVERTGQPMTPGELDFVYRLKTGALLEAAMTIGGVLAGCSGREFSLLEQCASAVGTAFQLQDDILDVTSSLEVLGKPVHSDERNEKTTWVTLHSLEEAQREVERLSGQAVRLLEETKGDTAFLTDLICSLVHRKK